MRSSSRGGNKWWRFEQQVPGIVESEGPTLAQLDAEIGGDMNVCAGDKGDRYAGLGNALP
jgi:hypothetical protein